MRHFEIRIANGMEKIDACNGCCERRRPSVGDAVRRGAARRLVAQLVERIAVNVLVKPARLPAASIEARNALCGIGEP